MPGVRPRAFVVAAVLVLARAVKSASDDYDANAPTTFHDWCNALGLPCTRFLGVPLSQPSSTAVCAALAALFLFYGARILVENHLRGREWAWVDSHFAEYLCRAPKVRPGAAETDATRERSRLLYGVGEIVFGLSVAFASANYQTFTYQLHCEQYHHRACIKDPRGGYDAAHAKSHPDSGWCAYAYLFSQLAATYFFVVGDVYRASRRHVPRALLLSVLMHLVFLVWVVALPSHGVDDLFSACLVCSLAGVGVLLVLSWKVRYEPRLACAAAVAFVAIVAYLAVAFLVDEEEIYARHKFWMHANDVLHVCMLPFPWALYHASRRAEDAPPGSSWTTENQFQSMKVESAQEGP
ncbi:hypothetical protein M885DRAFT_587258 [Pelagophyceae sp. CCMP2097]|nr:hypothetical protein M885DRAFT_587258 [Pelagophyceae sp. CCMP2097]